MFNDHDIASVYEAIEFEIKVFTVGHTWTNFTRWQGNSPEADAAWQKLYNSEHYAKTKTSKVLTSIWRYDSRIPKSRRRYFPIERYLFWVIRKVTTS